MKTVDPKTSFAPKLDEISVQLFPDRYVLAALASGYDVMARTYLLYPFRIKGDLLFHDDDGDGTDEAIFGSSAGGLSFFLRDADTVLVTGLCPECRPQTCGPFTYSWRSPKQRTLVPPPPATLPPPPLSPMPSSA